MISLFWEFDSSASNHYWLLLQDVHVEEFEKHIVSSFLVKLFLTFLWASSELQSGSISYWSESHHTGNYCSRHSISVSHGKDVHSVHSHDLPWSSSADPTLRSMWNLKQKSPPLGYCELEQEGIYLFIYLFIHSFIHSFFHSLQLEHISSPV